jgi:predicted nucleotidyltransferase
MIPAAVLWYNPNAQERGEAMAAAGEKQDKVKRFSELAEAYGIADIYVFGSRAAEIAAFIKDGRKIKDASSSDVDIGVRPKRESRVSTQDLVNLAVGLEELFGVNRVDLVFLPDAEPFLALDIIRGELLYADDPLDQAYYELFVIRRAGDLLPFKRERIDLILRGVAR